VCELLRVPDRPVQRVQLQQWREYCVWGMFRPFKARSRRQGGFYRSGIQWESIMLLVLPSWVIFHPCCIWITFLCWSWHISLLGSVWCPILLSSQF
jgi:hypothetical protein